MLTICKRVGVDARRNDVRSSLFQLGGLVRVGTERDGDGAVPEATADDFRVHLLAEQHCGHPMP